MKSQEQFKDAEDMWGTPEVHDFFMRWTGVHLTAGIYQAYIKDQDKTADFIEKISSIQNGDRWRAAARAELPLMVALDATNKDYMQVSFHKVDPNTGRVLAASRGGQVARVLENGAMVSNTDLYPGRQIFSAEQINLISQQLQEQNRLGITPTFVTGIPSERFIN